MMRPMDQHEESRTAGSRRGGRWQLAIGAVVLLGLGGVYVLLRDSPNGQRVAGDLFTVPYAEALDLTAEDRSFDLSGVRAEVGLTRPARPLSPIDFTVRITDGQGPVPDLKPELAFNMKMDMGRHAYRLQPDGEVYRARVTLPRCMKGGKRWFGRLRFDHAGRTHEQIFIFDLQP